MYIPFLKEIVGHVSISALKGLLKQYEMYRFGTYTHMHLSFYGNFGSSMCTQDDGVTKFATYVYKFSLED